MFGMFPPQTRIMNETSLSASRCEPSVALTAQMLGNHDHHQVEFKAFIGEIIIQEHTVQPALENGTFDKS